MATEDKDPIDRSSGSAITISSKLDRRIDIQPAEDENGIISLILI